MELNSVARLLEAFYRLTGTTRDDTGLMENGEEPDEVALLFLTQGVRAAQLYLLEQGYRGWRYRAGPIEWDEDALGQKYFDLTTLDPPFLRVFGDWRLSALRQDDGRPWGQLTDERELVAGNFWWIDGEELRLARKAQPPNTLYLDYHAKHPALDKDTEIDFPVDCRHLIVSEAAWLAMEESWLPGSEELRNKIGTARMKDRTNARGFVRPTKAPKRFLAPMRFGNRW